MKIKIKFAGVNERGHECYVTEPLTKASTKGIYLELLDDGYHVLTEAREYGFVGIDGEPGYKVKADSLEIVDSF